MTTPILSRYRVEDKLGEGGMGIVYRASDLRLGRTVALKMLRPETSANVALRQRLETEARAASLPITRPLPLFDFETDGDFAFLVYEYVNGKTLRDREIENPLELPDILSIFLKLAEGVAAAHDAGIIHRDLKPENVMITDDGRVKILDFGLAKVQNPDVDGTSIPTTATAPGVLLGTVAYMSPEQLEAGAVDHRTDIFALGTMLYEFVAKRHPFKGKSSSSTIGNILKEEPVDLSRWGVRAPRDLERDQRLCEEQEERYQSVRDFPRISKLSIGRCRESLHRLPLPGVCRYRKLAKSLFLIMQFGYLTLYGLFLPPR
jgi:serine/threonine protein kinase